MKYLVHLGLLCLIMLAAAQNITNTTSTIETNTTTTTTETYTYQQPTLPYISLDALLSWVFVLLGLYFTVTGALEIRSG